MSKYNKEDIKEDIRKYPSIKDNTLLQSPNLLLAAVGSTKEDGSAKGNHLRWTFAGKLAELHLPKGDYTQETFLFNKPNDYVKIYKARYEPVPFLLDFSIPPVYVNNNQHYWVYDINGKLFYIHFRNSIQYETALSNEAPSTNPLGFLNNYGGELIEIVCKNQLFFAATLKGENTTNDTEVLIELLSVKENVPLAQKILHTRKIANQYNFSEKLFCHNGRSCRYKISHGIIREVFFEFYSDFVTQTPQENWQFYGNHALSMDDELVLNRLEPSPDLIHGNWLRYNDGETVNINNYIHKWNGIEDNDNKNISLAVKYFLDLSTNPNEYNPTGIISSDDEPLNDENSLALLEVLKGGSIDYHVARMLGLGLLDLNGDIYNGEKFIYACEYTTLKNINNPEEDQIIHHLSLSLPTSFKDYRLPIPFELESIEPGILSIENGLYHSNLTDANGYTFEGDLRYVTLKHKPIIEEIIEPPFFSSDDEIDFSTFTLPIFAGVERRTNNETEWQKPEIRHDNFYKNIFEGGQGRGETIPIFTNEDYKIILSDKHENSGTYHYGTYGVNIFSRASKIPVELSIETTLVPKNRLNPPSNVLAQLIQKEDNLFFTTELEQQRLLNNPNSDKTLVRLVFDYNHRHELNSYQILDEHLNLSNSQLENNLINGLPNPLYPDNKELFADYVEVSFRNETPQLVTGKITSLTNHSSNPALLVIKTGVFTFSSQPFTNPAENTLTPIINANDVTNFIGGVLLNGDKQYIVHQIVLNSLYPEFHVIDKTMDNNPNYVTPAVECDGLFQLIENMQNQSTWNNPIHNPNGNNPHNFNINLNHLGPIRREVVNLIGDEGQTIKHLEKSRGFWANATITQEQEIINLSNNENQTPIYGFNGLYKLSFNTTVLPNPPQFNTNQESAEWFKGVVRLRTNSEYALGGKRETYEVVKMEFNQNNHLILYIRDALFSTNSNQNSIYLGNQFINYYPGFKIYLYKNTTLNLTQVHTLPTDPEDTKLTIFGLRAVNNQYHYKSKYSIPATMFGQLQQIPQQPQQPLGAKYATRPDFYGKSTYSFTTSFGENNSYRPHGLMFLRTNEELIFNALYLPETIIEIRKELRKLGGINEIWLQNRWNNFFDFVTLREVTNYATFPPNEEETFALPLPNNQKFIDEINEFIKWHNSKYSIQVALIQEINALNQVVINTDVATPLLIIDFIEEAIKNTYFALSETPIIFKYIKTDNKPNPKKQKIKDNNGFMLSPDDEDFDMAPMAKRVSESNNQIYFTDFTLDGTSQNIYFYAVKEMNLQMQMGDISKPLGPIKLVNSNPPEAPEIVNVMPILENPVLGISAAIELEINAYDKIHQINKIEVYRSFDRTEAMSIQTMSLIKTIIVDVTYLENQTTWKIIDDFSDLPEIPFGDAIYYRLVSCREVQYDIDGAIVIEYAPSLSSKLLATMVVENVSPESPILSYHSEPISGNTIQNIIFNWNKTCYKGIYHLYKMSSQGNWKKIHEFNSNLETMYLPLIDIEFQTSNLIINENGNPIYHHFKMIAENTAGMISQKENILTIYNQNSWLEIGGISSENQEGMIIDGTFIIRPHGLGHLTINEDFTII